MNSVKNNIQFYIPERITKLLAENKSRLRRNEKLRGGVLFFDLVQFTSLTVLLSESGPRGAEKLHELMTRYYDLMIDIIHRHGGSIYQFAGDSAVAAFEAKEGGDLETMLAMCACALEMRDVLEKSDIRYKEHKLAAKYAISYGEFYQVLLGDDALHFQVALLGSALDRVIQAEAAAKTNEIILSPELVDAVGDYAEIAGKTTTAKLERLNTAVKTEPLRSFHLADKEDQFLKKCSRFIPPVLLEKITASQLGYIGEFREVTSVFIQVKGADLSGDTKSFEILNSVYLHICELCRIYGGNLMQSDFSDKGSVFLVLFGAPLALEKKEIMAVRFAMRLLETAQEFSFMKNLSIGIGSGPLYCGDVGSKIRKGYSVLGESVNLASRLMEYSAGEFPMIDQKTAKALPEFFVVEENSSAKLKGISGNVSVFIVTGEKKEQKEKSDQSALIGRTKELFWLKSCMEDTKKAGVTAGILGDAGVGKSRLVFDFLQQAKNAGFEILTGICYSYEKYTPYFPWKSILLNIFKINDDVNADAALEKIENVLKNLPGQNREKIEITAWASVFYRLIGGAVEETAYTINLDPKKKSEQLFEYLGDILTQKTESGNILVLIEDYHWIDEGSENLVRFIMDKKIPGLMILAVSRPEGPILRLDSQEGYRRLNLEEFSDTDAMEYVNIKMDLNQSTPESEILKKEILSKARGNPFFLESIVYSLREQGVLIRNDNGKYELSGEKKDFEIPNSIQGVLLARIDRLGEAEKFVLKNASVIGRLFAFNLLKHLAPREMHSELPSYLSALEAGDFTLLESDDPLMYLFKHVLIRDVAYNSLLNATRETLHNQLALHLEGMGEDSIQENMDQLAYHFFHAKNREKAIEYGLKSARYASSNYSIADAIYHYGNILQLIDETTGKSDLMYDVKIELGHVYRQGGQFAEAIDIFQEPLEMVKDPEKLARIYTGIGQVYHEQGNTGNARLVLEKALKLLGENVPKSKAKATIGMAGQLLKNMLFGVIPFFPVKASGSKKRNLELRFEILQSLGKIYFFIDVERYGWTSLIQANISDKIDIDRFKGRSYAALALIYSALGLSSLADKTIKKGEQSTIKSNDPMTEAIFQQRTGTIGMYTNDPTGMYEKLNKAHHLYERFGEVWEKILTLGMMTLAYLYNGKLKEGNENNDRVYEMAISEDVKQFQGWALSARGIFEYALNLKSAGECIATLRKALEVSSEVNDRASSITASKSILYLLVREKRTGEALEQAKKLFAALNGYSSIIPHGHAGYYFIIEAMELGLNENLISEKEARKIWNTSLAKLEKLGKKYSFITGYALKARAKDFAFKGNLKEARDKIIETVEWYETTQNDWERALAYLDAAIWAPDKREEYTEKGLALCRQNGYLRDLIRFQKLQSSPVF